MPSRVSFAVARMPHAQPRRLAPRRPLDLTSAHHRALTCGDGPRAPSTMPRHASLQQPQPPLLKPRTPQCPSTQLPLSSPVAEAGLKRGADAHRSGLGDVAPTSASLSDRTLAVRGSHSLLLGCWREVTCTGLGPRCQSPACVGEAPPCVPRLAGAGAWPSWTVLPAGRGRSARAWLGLPLPPQSSSRGVCNGQKALPHCCA